MKRLLDRLFTEHPRLLGEGYFQHMVAALRFGLRLQAASWAALIHALVPGVMQTRASDTVRDLAAELDGRASEAREGRMRRSGNWDPGL